MASESFRVGSSSLFIEDDISANPQTTKNIGRMICVIIAALWRFEFKRRFTNMATNCEPNRLTPVSKAVRRMKMKKNFFLKH